jgi:hypothetical protein
METCCKSRNSCDLGTRIIRIKGTPSSSRSDLHPLDEVKDGELLNLRPTTKEKIIWDFN